MVSVLESRSSVPASRPGWGTALFSLLSLCLSSPKCQKEPCDGLASHAGGSREYS